MSNKHTPAPWKIAEPLFDSNFGFLVKNFAGKLIAKVYGFDDKQILANAKLIAAAPELLEALKKIANTSSDAPEAMRVIAKQAIKKATE